MAKSLGTTKYTMVSSSFASAVGMFKWARHHAEIDEFGADTEYVANVIANGWNLPYDTVFDLITGKLDDSLVIDSREDTVSFEVEG